MTFSIGMFSLHDPEAAESLQFHHTSPEVANNPNGTNEVDGDSIYRIASVTKVFTVLAALLNLNATDWELPFTHFFPELSETSGEDDPIRHVNWSQITPLGLANQISGVPRDGFPLGLGEILILPDVDPGRSGLPTLNGSDPVLSSVPCASSTDPECGLDPELYVAGVQERPPTFLPWTSPAYANNGFVLLGQVLMNITGKSIDEIFRDSIFDPLEMTSSNSTTPPQSEWSRSVIPGQLEYFAFDADISKSSGGLLSTINDLAKFGVALLNSTLLPLEETHKWMKPRSFTARLEFSVGAPWEISRYKLPSGKMVDLYTKSGDSGQYSSYLVLLPEFDAGFNILTAGTATTRTLTAAVIGDLVAETVIPTLMRQAAAEAQRNYAGTYRSTVQGLNTTLTLAVDNSSSALPGLALTRYISNGTNMLAAQLQTGQRRTVPSNSRLVPTIANAAGGEMAFQAIGADDAPNVPVGPISGSIGGDWVSVGSLTYGGIDTASFVFNIDSDGRAESVSPLALRATLERAQN